MRKLKWTPKQKEVLALVKQGKTRKEAIEAGFGRSTYDRVKREYARGVDPGEKKERKRAAKPKTPAAPPASYPASPLAETREQFRPETNVRIRTLDPVEIGALLIEPADWRINQYGGFLILNTYEHAREVFGYGGTVGDFLCEAVQVLRKAMGLDLISDVYLMKEEVDGGRKEDGEGEGVLAEAGHEPDGEDG